MKHPLLMQKAIMDIDMEVLLLRAKIHSIKSLSMLNQQIFSL
jgi:hypothetical protein